MKLGLLTVATYDKTLEETAEYVSSLGVQALEIGTGGCPGKTHLNPDDYLGNADKINELKDMISRYNLEIAALSCHGNAVHPKREIAAKYHEDFEKTVLLAQQMGIDTIVTFSGCPGGSAEDKMPNWVTCAWPEDFLEILDYQWNEVLIPYWKNAVKFANDHGIKKIALEMHPGFCVYNPETCMKLRKAVGDTIGANFDPSHLFWQGIDVVAAIRYLGEAGAIYHFHAKDTKIDEINSGINGVLDTKHYGDEINRSWIFRSVGYGHDMQLWKDIISNLRMTGYDGIISIEHEDSLMTGDEGLRKAIEFLKEVIIFERKGDMWWA